MTAAQLARYDEAKEAFWHALVRHNPQLALFSERLETSPHASPWDLEPLAEPRRLKAGTEPCCVSPPHGGDVAVPSAATPLLSGGSVPLSPTTRGAASLSGSRGAPREGA